VAGLTRVMAEIAILPDIVVSIVQHCNDIDIGPPPSPSLLITYAMPPEMTKL